jgi:RNA polymerase sigma-70 factor (ECF subfamily)
MNLNSEDKKLIEHLKKGDLHAFDALYRKYSNKLLFFTLGYLNINEDAEDLVQEVFLTIWRKHKKLNENHSFKSYLFTITYNSIKKYYRKKGIEKKHLNQFLENADEAINPILSEIEYKELTLKVNEIVQTFPERRKEIFKLSREAHLSNQEIADKLNITKKTVENHLTTSLKTLREQLGATLFFIICLFLL